VSWRWQWLALVGWALIAAGVAAFGTAVSGRFLPQDAAFLGMDAKALCALHGCRVVHFMIHDRVSFGGSLVAIGLIYRWLAQGPLAARERWAYFTFVASGATGFLSFLAYLGYGYLDTWHARATLLLLVPYLIGLWRTYPALSQATRPGPGQGRFRAGRALLLFTALGMVAAGGTILVVGMTRVFVPQDLEFIGASARDLAALNPRLIPLIAHDRAGFGGGIACAGLTIFLVTLFAVAEGRPRLWSVLAAAGSAGFGCAILVHPAVGYTSFSHLLPAYLGAFACATALALLRAPMVRGLHIG